jgi:hypothetical protein
MRIQRTSQIVSATVIGLSAFSIACAAKPAEFGPHLRLKDRSV